MTVQQLDLSITGMTCASCVRRVEKAMAKVPGVEVATVNLATEQATVVYDPAQATATQLQLAVEGAGYGIITDQLEFPITGMTCASCSARIEKALNKIPGVLEASVNLATERAQVTYSPATIGWSELKLAVEQAGYGVIETNETGLDGEDVEAQARARELADKRRKLLVGALFTVPLFLLSMVRDVGVISPWLIGQAAAMPNMPGDSMTYPAYADLLNWLFLVLATPVQFYSGRDFYIHAWAALKARTANMDTLITLGSSAAYIYSVWLLFSGLSGHVYFETAALIITLILVGKYLEAR
ncbi:MAG: copper ion binding protein [Roseiflexaceae bacterium]|nr:copper ion binding protein [Roseiflexaceae bacterium]